MTTRELQYTSRRIAEQAERAYLSTELSHLEQDHHRSDIAIDGDAVTDALCYYEDTGCRECGQLLDTFIARNCGGRS